MSFEITIANDFAGASDMSADGSVVVGSHASADGHVYRWVGGTAQTIASGVSGVVAGGTSQDGAVVVGATDSGPGTEAFRWESGTASGLGFLPGESDSVAFDISRDATTIVGRSGSQAFVHQGGSMAALADLAGGTNSAIAVGVNADGSVIVGSGNSAAGNEAALWQGGSVIGLGDLAGGDFGSSARGVSSDGSVVVGSGTGASGVEAFRWEAGTMVGLGQLGEARSSAAAVSDDGNRIVGSVGLFATQRRAVVWDPQNGMRDLKVVLESLGLDLTGIELREAFAVSADGLSIAGTGFDNTGLGEAIGWVATIPEPSTASLLVLGLAALAHRRRAPRTQPTS